MKPYFKILYILFCLSFFSCARIVMPKGGDKDVIPPKYVSSNPEMNAVNFKGNRIDINFDEYIVLDNATGKLIVSPPLKKKPVIGSKLKTLYIKDIDSLLDNTTYIFDFADAVTDYTESNRLNHFSFAFSTGENIDTLFYNGRLLNAYSHKAEAGKYVALYKNHDKQYIRKNLPDYITRTDSSGRFYLRNIKEGEYTVIAFEDMNQNMLYDLITEGFGTKMCNILPQVQLPSDTVFYNPAKDTVQKILSSKIINEREMQIITCTPVTNDFYIEFTQPTITKEDYMILKNKSEDTITFIATANTTWDTVKGEIKDINGFSEKLSLTYLANKRQNQKTQSKFAVKINKSTIPYFEKLTLDLPFFRNPSDTSQITALCFHNDDTIKVNFTVNTDNPKQLLCNHLFNEGEKYTLWLDSALFFDYIGRYNDTLRAEFNFDTKDDYGSLLINAERSFLSRGTSLTSDNTHNLPPLCLIISIFGQDGQGIKETTAKITDTVSVLFENLPEGKYTIKITEDTNCNGKWDKGNFDEDLSPERVKFHNSAISIRKGWQTTEDIK